MNLLKVITQKPWTLGSSLVTITLAFITVFNIENRIYLGYMQLALGSNQILSFIERRKDKTIGQANKASLAVGILCLSVGLIIVVDNATMK